MTAAVEWDDLARHAEAIPPEARDWSLIGGGEYITPIGVLVAPDDGGVTSDVAEFIAAANPTTILHLIEELRGSRETNRRLNRRVQRAEAGVRQNVEACERAGVSFGRILARSAAEMYRAERDELAARLAAVDEVIRIHDTTTDIAGGGRGLVPTDTLRAALATDTTKETP